MDQLLMSPALQTALVFVNAGIGLFMLMMSFTMRRLVKDLDDNTIATNQLASSVGELHTSIAKFYVSKTDFDALDTRHRREIEILTSKYDQLNREFGEMKGRVEYAVEHKKYA